MTGAASPAAASTQNARRHLWAPIAGFAHSRTSRSTCFSGFLLYAAVAFWLSRLTVALGTEGTYTGRFKDPDEFKAIVIDRSSLSFRPWALTAQIAWMDSTTSRVRVTCRANGGRTRGSSVSAHPTP